MSSKKLNTSLSLFNSLVLPYESTLFKYAMSITHSYDDANDLVQETLLRAYRFFHNFEQGSNLKAWLIRILKNAFINNYRRSQKEPAANTAEDIFDNQDILESKFVTENFIEINEYEYLPGDELSKAINELPDDFRTVIILNDLEDFTYEEIADFLDIPVGTVRSRLHRARKMLYTILLPYAQTMGYAA